MRKGGAAYADCRRLPAARRQCGSDRGERDRAAGMALTIQIVALRKLAPALAERWIVARQKCEVGLSRAKRTPVLNFGARAGDGSRRVEG